MKKYYFTKILPGNKTTLQILKRGIISDGKLVLTDLDQWVFVENAHTRDTSNDGKIYDLELLKKSADFKIAECNDFHRSEFPLPPEFTDGIPLPLEVPACLPDFAAYCSTDHTTRESLTGVYVNLTEGKVCATNGHTLRERTIKLKSKGEYIVPARAGVFTKAMKREILPAGEVNGEYLKLVYAGREGDIVTYYSQLVEGPYPDYAKIIPASDLGEIATATKTDLRSIYDAIELLQSRGSGYSKRFDPVIFDGDACIWNAAHGYLKVSGLPIIFKKGPRQFSASYLKQILKDLPDTCVTIQSLGGPCSATVFRGDAETFILQPLKPPDDENWPPDADEVTK